MTMSNGNSSTPTAETLDAASVPRTTELAALSWRDRQGRAAGDGARPRVLFLAQVLPYPPDTGVSIRTYHVLRLLSSVFDVTALCFHRSSAHRSAEERERSVDALRALASVDAFPIPQEHSRVRFAWDHVRSVLQRKAYTYYAYRSRAFRERLDALVRSRSFDLVHLDSLDLCGYLPLGTDAPTICAHHNVESKLLRRRAEVQDARWKRAYLDLQADLVEREERRWCERFSLNVAVSENDRDDLERLAPGGDFLVVPNGVDVRKFQPGGGADAAIAYLGGTEWFPNLDALDHFCEDVLPRLRRCGELPPVQWIGRAEPEQQRRYGREYGVELTGYVEDVRPYLRDAACVVVPLRVGGGTRLKITTAWAMGKAVVSTSVGCEGLDAVDGRNILIRDDPDAFAAAVRRVLTDDELRARLERGARSTAVDAYSWDVIGEPMLDRYRALARSR